MGRMTRNIDIFGRIELARYLQGKMLSLKGKIDSEDVSYISNVNVEDYCQHLVDEYQLELKIDFDGVTATPREEQIPADKFPDFYSRRRQGQSDLKQVITYHISYEGQDELLECIPNPHSPRTPKVALKGNCICFDVINFYDDGAIIKKEADRLINLIRQQFGFVSKNLEDYNNLLPNQARGFVDKRREQLLKQSDVLQALGVPIRKSTNVPDTFTVPTTRKKVIGRPDIPVGAGKPEPTLDMAVYEEILQTVHDTGKVFERLPSTYADKGEEALRDHLILMLEPRFEGSTTGETFNKSGKTDILIRHEGKNVFVAECKFWSGQRGNTDALDQLLNYLTWRDSKTALIYFVDRQDFTAVIRSIVESTKQHPNYVDYKGQKDESWHNFEFHLPGDPERKVKVAVLAFHLPRQ